MSSESIKAAPGSAATEPVFAAIESHRLAAGACDAATGKQYKQSLAELTVAQDRLLRTVPATPEGLRAFLDYVMKACDDHRSARNINLHEAVDALDHFLASIRKSCSVLLWPRADEPAKEVAGAKEDIGSAPWFDLESHVNDLGDMASAAYLGVEGVLSPAHGAHICSEQKTAAFFLVSELIRMVSAFRDRYFDLFDKRRAAPWSELEGDVNYLGDMAEATYFSTVEGGALAVEDPSEEQRRAAFFMVSRLYQTVHAFRERYDEMNLAVRAHTQRGASQRSNTVAGLAAESVKMEGPWFIHEVMLKDHKARPRTWVALLIDTAPDELAAGGKALSAAKSRWLELGGHKSRECAWAYAEQLLLTKH